MKGTSMSSNWRFRSLPFAIALSVIAGCAPPWAAWEVSEPDMARFDRATVYDLTLARKPTGGYNINSPERKPLADVPVIVLFKRHLSGLGPSITCAGAYYTVSDSNGNFRFPGWPRQESYYVDVRAYKPMYFDANPVSDEFGNVYQSKYSTFEKETRIEYLRGLLSGSNCSGTGGREAGRQTARFQSNVIEEMRGLATSEKEKTFVESVAERTGRDLK